MSVEAHNAEVNCIAFNKFCEYILCTGSADKVQYNKDALVLPGARRSGSCCAQTMCV
jgi:hypothetical protein